jgi:SNF2 family DNA or RNA helicase
MPLEGDCMDFFYFNCSDEQAQQLDAVFVKSRGAYRLPMTLGALREAYKVIRSDNLIALGQQVKSVNENLVSLKSMQDAPGPKELRPYQRVDIQFLKHLEHKGIFNQQRTGKTPTILKLIEEEQHNKVIIVCPASLRLNWTEEIARWTPYPSLIVTGTPTQRKKIYQSFYQSEKIIMVMSYETLRNDLEHLEQPFDCLALDEAHRIRNTKTKQTKAVNKLGKFASCRIAATGTPSVNHAIDVFGILQFLYPKRFTSYWQFAERYFHINDGWFGKDIGQVKRQQELTEILDTISTNRKRSDVMKWIPDVTSQVIKLEPDKQQLKEYTEMLKTFEVEHEGKVIVDAPNPLAQLTRLRQITLSPALLDLKGKSVKEQFILDYIEDNPNEPIIIFSTFTSYLRTLSSKVKGNVRIFGDMTAAEKQKSVRDFQGGRSNILLANIISGGVGFTLDRAETIIFLDRSYSPIDNEQAQDRFIPTKESNNHTKRTIIDLVVSGTVDEQIAVLLKEKKSIVDIVNNYGLEALLNT